MELIQKNKYEVVNVTMTVSRRHDGGTVGKVRLSSTVMRGSEPGDGRTDGWSLQEATVM